MTGVSRTKTAQPKRVPYAPKRANRRLVNSLKAKAAMPLICQRCKKRFVGVPLKDTCQCQRIKPKRGEQ